MSRDGQTREGSPPLQTTSPLEWGVALAGLVVVAGAVIYLLAYAALGAQGPPLMSLAKVSAAPMGEAYALRFEARNDGGATAANVQLSAELTLDGAVVERAQATLDYLPRNGRREGAFVFTRDPQAYEVRLRIESYAEP
ncbi:MAG TPA: hypothetical protein PKA17_04430 [Phenylobacterium sp.]|nr:hypothetical protein [Phenylobacterium sp.]